MQEKQRKTQSTDTAVVELVVIGIDFKAQTRQAIIAVIERLRHTTFREWAELPTARVELNNPLSGLEAAYDTTTEYVVTRVDLVEFHDVTEHILTITRSAESRVIVTLEGSGVGRNVLPLMKQYGVTHIVPINVTAEGRTHKRGAEWFVSLDRLNAHMNDMLASGDLKLKEDSPESSASIAYGIFIATRSRSTPIVSGETWKIR
jgi:hypothetical protein